MLSNVEGFDWDKGNLDKSRYKHDVSPEECEQVFGHAPLLVADDEKHSTREHRYKALGRTDDDRWLCIVFTLRGRLVRVISARPMNRKERTVYEEA